MRRHPLDIVSLAFGLAFTALGLALLDSSVEVGDLSSRWLGPSAAVLAGVILAITGASHLRKQGNAAESSTAAPEERAADRNEWDEA